MFHLVKDYGRDSNLEKGQGRPMLRLWGANNQVYWREAANHRSLVQIPYCPWPSAKLLHPMSFLTAEQDKLTAHVKGYSKHVGAAKAFKKSRVHKKKFLRTNPNLAHLTEGVYYIRLSRRESSDTGCRSIQAGHLYLFDWGKVSFVTSGFNPQDSGNCTCIPSRITRNGFAFKKQHFQRPIY